MSSETNSHEILDTDGNRIAVIHFDARDAGILERIDAFAEQIDALTRGLDAASRTPMSNSARAFLLEQAEVRVKRLVDWLLNSKDAHKIFDWHGPFETVNRVPFLTRVVTFFSEVVRNELNKNEGR